MTQTQAELCSQLDQQMFWQDQSTSAPLTSCYYADYGSRRRNTRKMAEVSVFSGFIFDCGWKWQCILMYLFYVNDQNKSDNIQSYSTAVNITVFSLTHLHCQWCYWRGSWGSVARTVKHYFQRSNANEQISLKSLPFVSYEYIYEAATTQDAPWEVFLIY